MRIQSGDIKLGLIDFVKLLAKIKFMHIFIITY